jgi:hypothetical protein
MDKLQIYIDAIQSHEPFCMLEIRSVRANGESDKIFIETCDEEYRSFYGLYAKEQDEDDDGLWWSIADSPSKVELFELATAFNIFSKFTLPIITKFEI